MTKSQNFLTYSVYFESYPFSTEIKPVFCSPFENKHNFGFREVERTVHGDWHFYSHLFFTIITTETFSQVGEGDQVVYIILTNLILRATSSTKHCWCPNLCCSCLSNGSEMDIVKIPQKCKLGGSEKCCFHRS